MRHKERAGKPQNLLIGLLGLMAATLAVGQSPGIDFEVVQLSRHPPTSEKYTAVRTQAAWDALWAANGKYPNSPPIPTIDFKKFILLIADAGPKPSSGYSIVFTSVQDFAAAGQRNLTSVQIVEISSGNCPVMTQLTHPISFALIPQTPNEIRFSISHADSNCSGPATPPIPPFIK